MRAKTATTPQGFNKANAALWIVQALLALVFLVAGAMKLMLPLDVLTQQSPVPGAFLRFIGAAETLGAIGLVLPGLLGIAPRLTGLAAAGLVIIMAGETTLTLSSGAAALFPFAVGVLAAIVAYARRGQASPSLTRGCPQRRQLAA